MNFPEFNNPFFRDSLRPLVPTAQQLRDKRYHPTVEAIYYKREQPNSVDLTLPKEGSIKVPVIMGRPGDPNRHQQRQIKEEEKPDEYEEFRSYEQEYMALQDRIAQIRARSALYPVWAADKPSLPVVISRQFNDLQQQLFSLKKCFVSPEEIMLDNTAITIQRFCKTEFQRRIYKAALESIESYKKRELTAAHRTLNSWMAQMEYTDSRAQQMYFRSVAKTSKISLKFWLKWAEKETIITNRDENKANDLNAKISRQRHHKLLLTWRDVSLGDHSRKALAKWRTSMIPIMERELENSHIPIPEEYLDLVISYVSQRTHRSFLFNYFLAWHTHYHSKSLKETVSNRNAMVLFKKHLTTRYLHVWAKHTAETKGFLKTPEKWAKYIALMRSQHTADVSTISIIVSRWHNFAKTHGLLHKMLAKNKFKFTQKTFEAWEATVIKHRQLKMRALEMWKKSIQDPKVSVFRAWLLYTIKKRTRNTMKDSLLITHDQWRSRLLLDRAFGRWQKKTFANIEYRDNVALERRKWDLQTTKHQSTVLSNQYSIEREKIASLEKELGAITEDFVNTEDEISRLEEVGTTWRIALHTMKMEILRLGLIVERCSKTVVTKRRRLSDEEHKTRILDDDRYDQFTESKLSYLQTSNRILSKWERRNSDPNLLDDTPLVITKPPFDDNIIQLLSIEKGNQ